MPKGQRWIIMAVLAWVLIVPQQAWAMSTAKSWVNKVRPGTFVTEEELAAKAKPKERVFTPSELQILTNLKQREDELNRKEEEFKKRTQELKLLSQQIEQKLDQMRVLQSQIEKRRAERKEMDAKDISRMVKYYETMTSENTAAFFNQMDRVTATQILMRMNPRKASSVMQLLEPKVAVDITERVTRFKMNQQELVVE